MSRKTLGLTVGLVLLLGLISVGIAQTRRPAPSQSPHDQLVEALNQGRYDQLASLAAAMNAQDPAVVALLARSAIARGRYQEAEQTLTPIAQRAPASDAALELGLLLDTLGRPGAEEILTRVARTAETATQPRDLARAARALQRLGRSQEANAAYRDATSMLPRDPDINTAWGELFLEKFNKSEALKSFQAALQANPKWVPALIGSAQALADDNPPQAGELIKQVLEINPGDVDANVFIAQQHVDAGKRAEAREALSVALGTNPNSLAARALLAGLAFIEDKPGEYDSELAKVLAIAPKYGEAYRVVAEIASHNFRYDDAAALVRKGVALDPNNAQILSDMGIHLLRTGDEPEARTVLEQSFKIDDFNQVTYNLLQMMDTLDTFVAVSDGNITVKMDKTEAPVMSVYAVPLARQAIDTLSKRYNFTPKGPIIVEIFPKHDDFAVRTAGLPGLMGALGVCFGRVVTMDSPRTQPGRFQWQATLWHELAHVITLQMSNHRVPRWLTEGISEHEEHVQNPEWKRSMEMEFATLLNRGETFTLKNLNAGFTDPRKITVAYYQASLFVDHLMSTYGDEGMQRLLRAYGEGLDTDAALKKAYNTDLDALQSGFDEMLDKKFGALRKALAPPPRGTDLSKMPPEMLRAFVAANPDSFGGYMFLGEGASQAGELDEAAKAFARAAELAPVATGEDSPQQRLAEIELQRKNPAAAIAALKLAFAADVDDASVARKLAELLKEQKITSPAELRPVYQRIVDIDPFDADAHAVLGRLAMQAGDPAGAVREFKAVVALGPIDKAAAHTDLAESLLKSGQRAEARRQTLAALEIAPSYERAQDLLLQLAGSNP